MAQKLSQLYDVDNRYKEAKGVSDNLAGKRALQDFIARDKRLGSDFIGDSRRSVKSVEIFQEDDYAGSSAPTGYTGFSDIEQSGKGKGACAMTVTNAAKNYLVIFKTDGYSEVTFGGTVDVP